MIEVTFPEDRSALGVLFPNRPADLQDGDDFRDDSWIWRGGRRWRKWYVATKFARRVWEPHLDRIAHLEAIRWRLMRRMDAFRRRLQPTLAEIAELPPIPGRGGRLEHAVISDGGSWIRVESIAQGPYDRTYFFQGALGEEQGALVTELGLRMSRLARYHDDLRCRLGLFASALEEGFVRRIRQEVPLEVGKSHGQQVCFLVNGRRYWMHAHRDTTTGRLRCERVSWPETEERTLCIPDEDTR